MGVLSASFTAPRPAAAATDTAATAPAPAPNVVPAFPRVGARELLDNDRGSAWDVIYPPGVPTAMHRHNRDFVGVELVESQLKLTAPDGKVTVLPVRRGEIYELPKGLMHIEETVIGHAQRHAIIIELKEGSSPVYPDASPAGAPTGFAAAGARLVTESAKTKLWDASWPQHSRVEPFFQSRDIYLVFIDGGVLSIGSADETSRSQPVEAGQVVFLRGGHVRTFVSLQGTVRAAVVEIK